jgi:acyl-CoA synthetase (AMP-forming)/AMP-acid ligase II
MDVRTLMRRSAAFYAGQEAVVHGDVRLTFAAAWERGLRLANGLLALGLQPGDRIGVLEDNCLSAADAYLGLTAANLVRVPLYPRNSREAHAHMLGHTGCRAVTTTVPYADGVLGLDAELPALEHVLVRDDGYEGWLATQPATDPDPPVAESDWYIIRHTAGTTGKSKAVHRRAADRTAAPHARRQARPEGAPRAVLARRRPPRQRGVTASSGSPR